MQYVVWFIIFIPDSLLYYVYIGYSFYTFNIVKFDNLHFVPLLLEQTTTDADLVEMWNADNFNPG